MSSKKVVEPQEEAEVEAPEVEEEVQVDELPGEVVRETRVR